MRFFLPAVFDTYDAEESMPNIKALVEGATGYPVGEGRIFSIEFRDGTHFRTVTVGDRLPAGTVECILESERHLFVCPFARGQFAQPLVLEKQNVVTIDFFDGFEAAWAA